MGFNSLTIGGGPGFAHLGLLEFVGAEYHALLSIDVTASTDVGGKHHIFINLFWFLNFEL